MDSMVVKSSKLNSVKCSGEATLTGSGSSHFKTNCEALYVPKIFTIQSLNTLIKFPKLTTLKI